MGKEEGNRLRLLPGMWKSRNEGNTPWMLPLGGIGCGAVVATIPATGIFWTSLNHYPQLSFNWRTSHGKLCTARLHTSSIFFTLLWGQWKGNGFNSASVLLSVLLPKSGRTLRTAVAICRNPRARSASKVAQFTSTTKRSILKTGSEEGGCTYVKTFCRQSSNRTIPEFQSKVSRYDPFAAYFGGSHNSSASKLGNETSGKLRLNWSKCLASLCDLSAGSRSCNVDLIPSGIPLPWGINHHDIPSAWVYQSSQVLPRHWGHPQECPEWLEDHRAILTSCLLTKLSHLKQCFDRVDDCALICFLTIRSRLRLHVEFGKPKGIDKEVCM